MKSPDEIKKGLECCFMNNCDGCPYDTDGCADNEGKADAIAYIDQLEQRLAQVECERDAAVYDLSTSSCCVDCKHYKLSNETEPCKTCLKNGKKELWQWRGVCEENSKEKNE